MSPKTRVFALAGFVAILAFAVIFEIVHHRDQLLQRPAAVASAPLPSSDGIAKPAAGQGLAQPAATPPPATQVATNDNPANGGPGETAGGGGAGGEAQSTEAGSAPASAGSSVPAALNPATRTFIVDTDTTAELANRRECELTQGDVLTRVTNVPDSENRVNVLVGASKRTDCPSGQTVSISVDDLQEMHNHFQERLTDHTQVAGDQGKSGSEVTASTPAPPTAHAGPLPIEVIIANAQAALANKQLITPEDNSALYWARRARRLDPTNETATKIENAIFQVTMNIIQQDRKAGRYQSALDRVAILQHLYPNRPDLVQLQSVIQTDERNRTVR
jgi:hypothetical protein